MITIRYAYRFVCCFLVAYPPLIFCGQKSNEAKPGLYKKATNDHYAVILINNIFNYYSNNGDGSYNNYNDGSGLEYPKGSSKTAVFEDGITWGGYQKGLLKMGGSWYYHALQAGSIITSGTATAEPVAANPGDVRYRVYRVRPDINPTKAFADVQKILVDEEVPLIGRYETVTASSLYDQYIKDWNEWPARDGAPFKDVNGNGVYEPAVDIPGVPGSDQTLWHVSNDLDTTRHFAYSSNSRLSMGLEFQRTIWAYKRAGTLNNCVFIRSKLINKSGSAIDSMFIAQWSDTDLGDAADDRVGCDTVRDMGYCYNGNRNDSYYGEHVPAVGYVMLQGPICLGTLGDSALYNSHYRHGYRNLKLTAFDAGQKNSSYNPDANTDTAWYGIFHGLTTPGAKVIDPTTGAVTKFWFPGDPVNGTGWISSMSLRPMDARFTMSSGPFAMAPGDTQEVITAVIVAQAWSNLISVSYLRSFADEVRQVYRSRFEVPLPITPIVTAPPLHERIVITWSDSVRTTEIESFDHAGYKFEGYNLYALPGPEFKNAVRLATYDRVNGINHVRATIFDTTRNDVIEAIVQWGTDNGIQRYYETTTDTLTNHFIANYHTYYFAVSAYYVSVQPDALPQSLESPPAIIAVTPMPPNPGIHLGTSYGDTISVHHISGISDALVTSLVIDPTKVTGHAYKMTFDTTGNRTTWELQDTTVNPPRTILANQTNFSNTYDYPIVDGVQVHIIGGSISGMKDYAVSGIRRWSWSGGESPALEGFNSAIGWNEPSVIFHVNSQKTLKATDLHKVQIDFADAQSDTGNNGYNFYAGWNPNTVPDNNFSYGYRYVAGSNLPARPEFTPYLVGKTIESWEFVDYKKAAVPFSAWDIETIPATRLAVGFSENNTIGGLVDGRYWPPVGGKGETNTSSSGPQEWFFIFNAPYTGTTPNPALQKNIVQNAIPIMWMGTVTRRNENPYASGDKLEIIPYYPLSVLDIYAFQTPSSTNTVEQALQDIDRINVFPNPYFGLHGLETSMNDQFITFTHLPQRAVIRIFTLGGWLIRTFVKDDPSSTIRWNLTNENNFSVAGGIYVAYIELPDFGKTKKLKFAVITRVMIPEHY
jgi:hypothetical protein